MRAGTIHHRMSLPVSLASETAGDRAARFLRGMIFSGELAPDDKLPPERDLGARLGISRMTLRLALKALESTGYLVTTRGSQGGSRVAEAAALLDCWKQWMQQHSEGLDDIFEFRTTVEERLAFLAAERRTESDLESMTQAVAPQLTSGEERSSLSRADMGFHRALACASGSSRLQQAMIDVRGELFLPIDMAHLEDQPYQIHGSHRSILEAVRGRNPERASEEMRGHIELIRRLVDKALEAAGINPPKGRSTDSLPTGGPSATNWLNERA